MRSVQALIVLVAFCLLGFATAPAQQRNPLVGTWSMQTGTTQGQYTGSIITTFEADGRFLQRWIVPAGTTDYTGTYTLSADRNVIGWVYRDYNPKFTVPSVQLNTPFNTPIQWVSDNVFLTQDAGGTNRWVRQPR